MAQGEPYVHFKVINERLEAAVDHNYLWATCIEANKGPINQPVYVSNAASAYRIFGVDVSPFYANGGKHLILVRVASGSDLGDGGVPLLAGKCTIKLGEDFKYKIVEEETFTGTDIVKGTINDGATTCMNRGGWYVFEGDSTLTADVDTLTPLTTEQIKDVKVQHVVVEKVIPAGTDVISVDALYPGDYELEINVTDYVRGGFSIAIHEEGYKSTILNHVTKLQGIINGINNKGYNVVCSLTDEGKIISKLTDNTDDDYKAPQAAPVSDEATNEFPIGSIIAPSTGKYEFELARAMGRLTGGSNGNWENGRVKADYQNKAHTRALSFLEKIRLAGVFCLYGEDDIQLAYQKHAKFLNDGSVCKWRRLFMGANETDRESFYNLQRKAEAFNDQYICFLGQGLLESDGRNETYIPPHEAVMYIAGLRSGLFYGNTMFGGQSIKEIKPRDSSLVLNIAPLYKDDETVLWQPEEYIDLNESGVLTFTENYNQISLTDGVTTIQESDEEDEEGVVAILQYAQNRIHDVCTTYIGRNITDYTKSALEEAINNVLDQMQSVDGTLVAIPTEGISAYEVSVDFTPRASQLLGKIYIFLKITPVHAIRQIEVEMTVE